VAIAEHSNSFCSAEMETIKQTDIRTPLGKVVISRIVSPGKVVLAGANNRRELRAVMNLLGESADLTIIDGALNRIAPMVEADCLILVTGAARCAEIPRLAAESRCMVDILSMPALTEHGSVQTVGSIFNRAGFETFMEKCSAADSVRIHGVMAEQYIKELGGMASRLKNKRLIFNDPIKLFLAGEPVRVWNYLRELSAVSVEIGVEKTCKLLAMTVNPYYPKYRYSRADYQEAYVDGVELLESVGSSIQIPCYDVVRQGGQVIFQMIMDYRKTLV